MGPLLRGSSREILLRLANGDPLELHGRVSAALRRQDLLLSHERVLMRAWALCAREAARRGATNVGGAWLEMRVAAAIKSLLEEGALVGSEDERACSEFNRLPRRCRRSFLHFVLEGKSLESLTYPGGPSAPALARDARRALLALLRSDSLGVHA
ncbi:MAG: hypothetical protein ACI8X5_002444 [Planctomycetota bacterium]|jgi:hypothetical protein